MKHRKWKVHDYDRPPLHPNPMKQKLIELFTGIIAGDGDIGSRMASSHPGAKPPYPPPIDSYVENLYKDLRQGKFNHLTPEQIKALATELADRVLKIMG